MIQVPVPPLSQLPTPREVKTWMIALTAYLRSRNSSVAVPVAILFEDLAPSEQPLVDSAKAVVDGMVMYDSTQDRLVLSAGGAWWPLALIDDIPVEAYGGFRLTAPVAGADITSVWQRITLADQVQPTPKNMQVDLASHRFKFDIPGVYQVTINLAITHNNSGSARVLDMRVRSEDSAYISGTVYVPSPGSTRATQTSFSSVVTLVPSFLDKWFVVEVAAQAGDPDYTSVEWATQAVFVNKMGDL